MRAHSYPGLFGDPRSRGLGIALTASLVLHAMLFMAFGRFQIRPVDRSFFAPLHMVELVEPKPGPPASPGPAPVAEPSPEPAPPAPPKKVDPTPPAQLETEPPPAPPKKPPPKPALSTKPAPEAKPVPAPTVKSEPEPQPYSEERVAERIARLRDKLGTTRPETAQPARTEQDVRRRIETLRERLASKGAGGPQTAGPAGIRRSGGGVLQEVRLRAYYNQLWDHVTRHWAIPPSLKGKPHTVIVSAVIDRKGTLLKAWVEEPSGSEAFDRAALSALTRAEPLPPIPDALPDDSLEVGFRFHPE